MTNLLFYFFCPMQFTEQLAEQLIRRAEVDAWLREWQEEEEESV